MTNPAFKQVAARRAAVPVGKGGGRKKQPHRAPTKANQRYQTGRGNGYDSQKHGPMPPPGGSLTGPYHPHKKRRKKV